MKSVQIEAMIEIMPTNRTLWKDRFSKDQHDYLRREILLQKKKKKKSFDENLTSLHYKSPEERRATGTYIGTIKAISTELTQT